jgi:hypothetical protein
MQSLSDKYRLFILAIQEHQFFLSFLKLFVVDNMQHVTIHLRLERLYLNALKIFLLC